MAQVLGSSAKRAGTTPGLSRGEPSIENCRAVETFQNVSSNESVIALNDGMDIFRRRYAAANDSERSRLRGVACRFPGDRTGVFRKPACASRYVRQAVPVAARTVSRYGIFDAAARSGR